MDGMNDPCRGALIGQAVGDALGCRCQLITCAKALPTGMRILMHCESGLGRTACMAAAYWIAKGLAADEAWSTTVEAVAVQATDVVGGISAAVGDHE